MNLIVKDILSSSERELDCDLVVFLKIVYVKSVTVIFKFVTSFYWQTLMNFLIEKLYGWSSVLTQIKTNLHHIIVLMNRCDNEDTTGEGVPTNKKIPNKRNVLRNETVPIGKEVPTGEGVSTSKGSSNWGESS